MNESISPIYIYKILHQHHYETFQKTGSFKGTDLDLSDGYIHCSTEEQWPKTLEKFFSSKDKPTLVKIDSTHLVKYIRWEISPRSGQTYPHVYSDLPFTCVVEARELF